MFCSVRNWKQASSLALAFACISAFQNVSFAVEVEKPKSTSAKPAAVELEAQAHSLTLDPKAKPVTQANVATEVKNKTAPTGKGSAISKIVTTAKTAAPSTTKTGTTSSKSSTTLKTTINTSTSKPTAEASQAGKTSSNKAAASETASTKSSTTSTAATKKTNEKNVAVTDGEAKKTATSKTKKSRKAITLVPPPPPTMPTYLNSEAPIAGSFDLGLSVNYMSLDDLKFQRKTLEKKLEAAQLDDKDQKRSNNDKQERAKRFVELYEEGVVSRRELETAKDEAERAIRDTEQTHIKVSEIQRVLGQVKERITSMEAAKQPFKVSSKKSKTR